MSAVQISTHDGGAKTELEWELAHPVGRVEYGAAGSDPWDLRMWNYMPGSAEPKPPQLDSLRALSLRLGMPPWEWNGTVYVFGYSSNSRQSGEGVELARERAHRAAEILRERRFTCVVEQAEEDSGSDSKAELGERLARSRRVDVALVMEPPTKSVDLQAGPGGAITGQGLRGPTQRGTEGIAEKVTFKVQTPWAEEDFPWLILRLRTEAAFSLRDGRSAVLGSNVTFNPNDISHELEEAVTRTTFLKMGFSVPVDPNRAAALKGSIVVKRPVMVADDSPIQVLTDWEAGVQGSQYPVFLKVSLGKFTCQIDSVWYEAKVTATIELGPGKELVKVAAEALAQSRVAATEAVGAAAIPLGVGIILSAGYVSLIGELMRRADERQLTRATLVVHRSAFASVCAAAVYSLDPPAILGQTPDTDFAQLYRSLTDRADVLIDRAKAEGTWDAILTKWQAEYGTSGYWDTRNRMLVALGGTGFDGKSDFALTDL